LRELVTRGRLLDNTLHENGLYLAPDKMRIMIDERLQTADAKTRLDLIHVMNLLVLRREKR
jgi:hypothetical protein